MKVNVPGDSPLERLTTFTRLVVAVPKTEIQRDEVKRKRKAREKKARRKR